MTAKLRIPKMHMDRTARLLAVCVSKDINIHQELVHKQNLSPFPMKERTEVNEINETQCTYLAPVESCRTQNNKSGILGSEQQRTWFDGLDHLPT